MKVRRNSKIMPFNSHPHKEDDISIQYHANTLCSFNSHPHKEDDRIPATAESRLCPFNSHPHKEDDHTNFRISVDHLFFQLTSSQGG